MINFQNILLYKNVVISMTCIIKYDAKFYPEIFLEEALFVK